MKIEKDIVEKIKNVHPMIGFTTLGFLALVKDFENTHEDRESQ